MKTLLLSDEVNQFHWSMLKAVALIVALLPLSVLFQQLWQSTEGGSQIVVGFMAMSVFSATAVIGFYYAIHATVMPLQGEADAERLQQHVLQLYRYLPMTSLAMMLSYLAYALH